MTRRDFGKPAFSLRKKTLRENTCPIASGDYSTPVSQRKRAKKGFFGGAALAYLEASKLLSQDKSPESFASCIYNAGLSYLQAKKYAQAEDYLQHA